MSTADTAAKVTPPVRKSAKPAKMRRRHWFLILSTFVIFVIPVAMTVLYLNTRAAPQYSSTMSFSIRSEEYISPLDALSGLGQLSSGTTSDAQIVYQFIDSQKIVRTIDANIDLRALYSEPDNDPVFTIDADVPVEKLVRHWRWMVQANLDNGSGLITVEAFAFDAQSAQDINRAILLESQGLVDALSQLAREDALKYATADLDGARERLVSARQNLSTFRASSRIIDPSIDVQSQGGVTAALQQQLAEALIEYDLLSASTSSTNDPRLEQARVRIDAIETRLEAERESLASGVGGDLIDIVGDYEGLIVEREFAEQAFLSAAAAFDNARTDAERRTKYLAVHIEPTLADTPLYPRTTLISAVVAALLLLILAVFLMISYSIRDRR